MDTVLQSRRERREMNRSLRDSDQRRNSRRRMLGRLSLWGGVALALAGVIWLMLRVSPNTPFPSGGNLAVPVSAADHILGPADAPITLVEYADFQCPACATFYGIIKQLMAEPELRGKVRFVYRHFPLTRTHQNAQLSSQAAEAAARQGKFWEMYDKLYPTQAQWENLSTGKAEELFARFAQQLGLNVAQWTRDLTSDAVEERIAADVTGANAAAVDATPTFFVNGVRMAPPSNYEQFKQNVMAGLTAPSPTPR